MPVINAEVKSEFVDDFNKKIDRRFVHKANDENVVISNIIRRNDLGAHTFECILYYNEKLPIPGLLVIEAARQMVMATVHKFYDVDFDTIFISDVVNCKFTNFIEFKEPVVIQMAVDAPENSNNIRKGFSSVANLMQHGEIRGVIDFRCTCIPK